LGEEIIVQSLKKAYLWVKQSANLTTTFIQACDDHFVFIHSSNLDIAIRYFNLPYDPDRLRDSFNRLFKN
jgi:hypothetical protein